MKCVISVGSISWIDGFPNPVYWAYTADSTQQTPDWIPKTYLGLYATHNTAPPPTVPDFRAYRSGKDIRSMTYCRIEVDIDETTSKVIGFTVLDSFVDPGWTPPFSMWHYPTTALTLDWDIYSSWRHSRGEMSSVSKVTTLARHKSTTITGIPNIEVVLVDALVKFRAGKHTDDLGVNKVKSPYHVPWVWCEVALTYDPNTRGLKLYGRGSVFPSHAWYLDGDRVLQQAQVGDITMPTKEVEYNPPRKPGARNFAKNRHTVIQCNNLKIYPVLTAGAPASGPQTPLSAEASLSGPVEKQPNAVSGGPNPWSYGRGRQ